MADLTKSQVNKAGRVARHYFTDFGAPQDPPNLDWAIETVQDFRAAHQYPLTKANMGLRSVLQSRSCHVEVTQRLKRVVTIFDKLSREPTMQLANMHDIGGCRAVVNTIHEIRRAEAGLKHNRPILRVADYLTHPKPSGYRALHIVVTYADESGFDRAIEVQLRTRMMNDWAWTVERLGGRMRVDLKSGIGPQPVLEFLEAASEAMAIEEGGQEVRSELVDRVNILRSAALPYIGAEPPRRSRG